MTTHDTARFNDPAWAAGHEDYFSQRLDAERLRADPAYAAGADYAAEDDAAYQDELSLLADDEDSAA